MIRQGIAGLALALLVLGQTHATARAETFRLTSLDWPPYSGATLPDQGYSVKVAREAFAAMGHALEVEFYPWKRAVQTGLGEGYVGYFPEYHSDDLAAGACAFSDPAGSGPLGLVESTRAPLAWTTLDDLKGRHIGVVSGYVTTPGLAERARAGTLVLEAVTDDLTNIRKVAAGRIDAAEIDANVMTWLVDQNPELKGSVQMSPHLLDKKKLYVCFQKTETGSMARSIFNEGLKKITLPAVMAVQ
ncbi:substrate-binding periplasmic protein [Pararhodospirillum oryzae]|uniref:ABC transporter n=1 Tax=Pararhodospirillum oryzae TaxID=478448 RepID=A0A512H4X4_9PROT|nr:transporter substrate-binding domain-containing protein [Pararhodospirillum oryzae]GEO80487.1 ABC transporter [Pararhodospirillum oryzae]